MRQIGLVRRRTATPRGGGREGFDDMLRRVFDTSGANGLVGFVPGTTLDQCISGLVEEQRG